MDNVVDRYFPILDALESELEQIEEQIFVRNAARSNIESLYALKQKLMVLKHAVDPLMEATGTPLRRPRAAGLRRDAANISATSTITCTASTRRSKASAKCSTTAIQVNLGMISLSENEVTKKLAAWAAIIAVPTMVAGIYGMNFEYMPELKWTFGYPLAVARDGRDRRLPVLPLPQAEVALSAGDPWRFRS